MGQMLNTIGCDLIKSTASVGMAASSLPRRPLVFCGPSGVGKSTIIGKLLQEFPDHLAFSISYTSRPARAQEQNGVDYQFVTREQFEAAVARNEFLEHANYGGNLYGTSRHDVETVCRSGRLCLLDVDAQGVRQLKRVRDFDAVYVFVAPPSVEQLETRLRRRRTETEESLKRRLTAATEEIAFGTHPGNMDVVVVNDNLQTAYDCVRGHVTRLLGLS